MNEVWGKVIFSQVCVSHSVHGGWGSLYDVTSYLAAWSDVPFRGGLCLGVSVQGVSLQGISVHGGLCLGSLCPGGSLSKGALFSEVSVWGSLSRVISVQGDLCPGGSLSRVVSVQGVSV